MLSACSKSALEEEAEEDVQVEITKQDIYDLIDAGTFTYAQEIKGQKVDVESVVRDLFSAEEIEDLVVKNLYKVHYPDRRLGDRATLYFDDFRQRYNYSFADEFISDKEKEAFTREFLIKNPRKKVTVNSSEVCTNLSLFCTDLAPNGCIEETNIIYYRQSTRVLSQEIEFLACARSTGTSDCDFSYSWGISEDAFFDVNSDYRWRWYNSNFDYRFWMADNISGYKIPFQAGPTVEYYASTFIGEQHEFAMDMAYGEISFTCHDLFIDDTHFFTTNAKVDLPVIPSPWPQGPNKNGVGTSDDKFDSGLNDNLN